VQGAPRATSAHNICRRDSLAPIHSLRECLSICSSSSVAMLSSMDMNLRASLGR
jgi:hypothetical protein